MHAADEAHDPGERVELLGLASTWRLPITPIASTNTAPRTAATKTKTKTKTKIKPQPGQNNDTGGATRPNL
jgi:hypothetical protein